MHPGKYSPSAISLAVEALNSDVDSTSGLPWVTAFEEEFARFTQSKFAIAVNSGTSGLHAALMAAGIGPGDEVISPALTVIMDAFSTCYLGATPVFADVDKETWNIDPKVIESLITTRTKALIAVSWFGLPANLPELRRICDKYGLFLLDDSAETMDLNGLRNENSVLPDARMYSFESKKHMSTGGEGGMVTTDNEQLAERIRKSAGLGYKHLTAGKGRTSLASRVFQNPGYERFDSIGLNYRMTPVTAAIGIGQLRNISQLLNSRKANAKLMLDAIDGCSWLVPQPLSQDGIDHTYYTFGVNYKGDVARGVSWQEFYDRFCAMGGDGFYSNCKNPYLEPHFKGKKTSTQSFELGLCPVAENLQSRIMAFKTNYLDQGSARKQAEFLSILIDEIGRE
jgi:perosamine synthetase